MKKSWGPIALLAVWCASASGQEVQQTIFPNEVNSSFRFGNPIGVEGNTLVIADRGAKTGTTLDKCGAVDDGSVHVYKRSSASAAWSFNQTLLRTTREGHFGEFTVLRGNTLLVTEERADDPNYTGSSYDQRGGFHIYTRTSESASFTKLASLYSPSEGGGYFTQGGFGSNGRYIAAASGFGQHKIYVYKITATGATLLHTIAEPIALTNQGSNLGITDNDILVVSYPGVNKVRLVKLTDANYTELDASALTLPIPYMQNNHVYTGTRAISGNEVVLAAQGQGATPPYNVSYYLKTFNLSSGSVASLATVSLPTVYSSVNDWKLCQNGIAIKDKNALFVNFQKKTYPVTTPLVTLSFKYFEGTSSYNFAGVINQGDYQTVAPNPFVTENYDNAVAYDGQSVYVGDMADYTNGATLPSGCAAPAGAVRQFPVRGNASASINGAIKLTDYFPSYLARFGADVALHGEYAIVGAPTDADLGTNQGAATLFKFYNGIWTQVSKYVDPLLSLEGVESNFGNAVAIDQEYIAIGSPGSYYDYGSVVVTSKSAPKDIRILTAIGGEYLEQFGLEVAVAGNIIVVGAPGSDTKGTDAGAVYVFEGYNQIAKLTASDGAAGDQFGYAVAIHGDYIAIGAPYDDNGEGTDAGATYIFKRSGATYTQTKKLTASYQTANTLFGSTLSLFQNNLVVSGPNYNAGTGSVYAFKLSGADWVTDGVGLIAGSVAGGQFGTGLSVNNENLLIGAPLESSKKGRVYRYQRINNAWALQASIVGTPASRLGLSVDIDNTNSILGGYRATNTSFTLAGEAYIINPYSISGNFREEETAEAEEATETLRAFPNPSHNQVTIEDALGGDVTLSNAYGQMVLATSVDAGERKTIQVADLPKGIYILRVRTEGAHREKKIMVD